MLISEVTCTIDNYGWLDWKVTYTCTHTYLHSKCRYDYKIESYKTAEKDRSFGRDGNGNKEIISSIWTSRNESFKHSPYIRPYFLNQSKGILSSEFHIYANWISSVVVNAMLGSSMLYTQHCHLTVFYRHEINASEYIGIYVLLYISIRKSHTYIWSIQLYIVGCTSSCSCSQTLCAHNAMPDIHT